MDFPNAAGSYRTMSRPTAWAIDRSIALENRFIEA